MIGTPNYLGLASPDRTSAKSSERLGAVGLLAATALVLVLVLQPRDSLAFHLFSEQQAIAAFQALWLGG